MRSLVLTVIVMAAGCSSREPAPFLAIAEALTADGPGGSLRVERRLFTAPGLADRCGRLPPIERLEVFQRAIELRVGQRFPLNSLNVTARGAGNAPVSEVPVVIEVEDVTPALLNVGAEDEALDLSQLFPKAAGEFQLRVRALCAPEAASLIPVRVAGE